MAKKMRPNLKGFLKTGAVRIMADSEQKSESAARSNVFLDLLTPADQKMWQPLLDAGTTVQVLHLDVASIIENYHTIDVNRFTYYTLVGKGEPLRPVRAVSQIQPPLALVLKWDETGVLTVYDPNV